MAKKPVFYFSLRSPYSWFAYRELLDRYPDVAATVTWRPFFEPDPRSEEALREARGSFPYVAMSRAKHLYILRDVGRLAKERGLSLTWPVDHDPVWEVPHLAYLVALREGRGPEFVAAAYRTRWEEGGDICDRSVIARIAGELGLDPVGTAGASDDPALREEGTRLLLDVCRDGVFGVPFFVNGSSRYWGVDRLERFVAEVRAGREPEPVPPAAVPGPAGAGSDFGHAGGCG
ncbi:2-hydroxychromene-2-carboxylate isomerase [Streptomyces sp. NPDC102451]|uniref:2-hydroxychromene-2-carboxylate isomerase n=1 Tax=Streptomyces sp. NPDC102451 TaxID=3366177 RepID=UPI00380CD6B7